MHVGYGLCVDDTSHLNNHGWARRIKGIKMKGSTKFEAERLPGRCQEKEQVECKSFWGGDKAPITWLCWCGGAREHPPHRQPTHTRCVHYQVKNGVGEVGIDYIEWKRLKPTKCCSRIFSIRRKTDDGISVRMDTKLEIHLEAFWDVSTCPQ
mmetsp:Transcript_21627/g.60185  ORF Transcript_21627/g.60185 Transcript_21627/m.60185 type:complete len:152 (+) Transcript_21627:195-650(+)